MLRQFWRWLLGIETVDLDDWVDDSADKPTIHEHTESLSQSNIRVFEIIKSEQLPNIVSALRMGDTVSLNTSFLNGDAKRDALSYLEGATFALEGSSLKIGDETYFYLPRNVYVRRFNQPQPEQTEQTEQTDPETNHPLRPLSFVTKGYTKPNSAGLTVNADKTTYTPIPTIISFETGDA